jgi:ABC-type dipeptide/oligopeptide/nickel transport system permease subunit
MSKPANTPATPPGAWRRLIRNRTAVASMAVLGLIALLAAAGPALFHTDPHGTSSLQFAPPSSAHPFGTDLNGRDVFSRVLEGARISLLVGLSGALVSFLIGTTYGVVSGYIGGRVDGFMMRTVEVLYAIPRLILILIASFVFDPLLKTYLAGFWDGQLVGYSKILILILSLGLIEWLTMARIVRGQVMSIKKMEFIEAARSLGLGRRRIIFRHILPNMLGPIIVYTTLTIPGVMLLEAFLSFLGLGVQPPMSSWGVLIKDGAEKMEEFPWLLIFPGTVFSLTLFSLNFLGDGLRDALDVRSSKD